MKLFYKPFKLGFIPLFTFSIILLLTTITSCEKDEDNNLQDNDMCNEVLHHNNTGQSNPVLLKISDYISQDEINNREALAYINCYTKYRHGTPYIYWQITILKSNQLNETEITDVIVSGDCVYQNKWYNLEDLPQEYLDDIQCADITRQSAVTHSLNVHMGFTEVDQATYPI